MFIETAILQREKAPWERHVTLRLPTGHIHSSFINHHSLNIPALRDSVAAL